MAEAADTGWRWLVASGVQPTAQARQALEDAARRRPDARVIASVVVRPDGKSDAVFEPWPELFDKRRAVAAARDRLLAARGVHAASLLVREDVLEEHGLPP